MTVKESEGLSVGAHVMCGWPLLMITFGGIVGATLGIVSYSMNVRIYKSNLSISAKITLNIVSGGVAFIIYAFISGIIVMMLNL